MTKKTFMMFALLCLTLWGLGGMGAWAQTARHFTNYLRPLQSRYVMA